MKLTLYYTPLSCALVPLISLHESGTEFELRPVNIAKGEHLTPEFLRINPKHKVPTLLIDGKPLTENVAIALWLARAFPRAGILPADSEAEIRAIALMAWCSSGIHPQLTRIFAPARFCDTPGSEESLRRFASKELDHVFGIADGMLLGREYFFDDWCAADSHFFWAWRRAITLGQDFSKYRACVAHYERMQRRPAVMKALAYDGELLADFAKVA